MLGVAPVTNWFITNSWRLFTSWYDNLPKCYQWVCRHLCYLVTGLQCAISYMVPSNMASKHSGLGRHSLSHEKRRQAIPRLASSSWCWKYDRSLNALIDEMVVSCRTMRRACLAPERESANCLTSTLWPFIQGFPKRWHDLFMWLLKKRFTLYFPLLGAIA